MSKAGREQRQTGHTEVVDDLAEAVVLACLALAARHQRSVAADQLRSIGVLLLCRKGGCESGEGEDTVDELHFDCGCTILVSRTAAQALRSAV